MEDQEPEVNPEALEAETVQSENLHERQQVPNSLRPIGTMAIDVDDIDPEAIALRAEKMATAEVKLRQIALKLTNKSDWVDEGGRPYLQWSGAARIASAFGVSYYNLVITKEIYKDDKGEYYLYECKGEIKWRGRNIEEIGTGSTRDPFFGVRFDREKQEKYFLPLSEVDIPNVKKKAQTNFLNRGLKSIAGLSFTWEEVTEATGLKPEDVGGKIDYNKKKTKNLDDPKRIGIKKMLVEMHSKNASVILQGLTTFKAPDGKQVPGKKKVDDCTDPQIKRLHTKVTELYKEWKKNK